MKPSKTKPNRGENEKNQKPEWRVWGGAPSGRARTLLSLGPGPALCVSGRGCLPSTSVSSL